LGRIERRVMSAIVACRTAALGGHVEACDDCGVARAQWLAARQAELLAVPYFHVVFTLPAPIAAIAFQNKAVVYAILFAASAEAMTTLAANPRRLGAQIGVVAVLHTWGQTLTHHPHVHCVAPSGGLSLDGTRWVAGRPNFFLAVKPLSRLFRRLFLERLRAAFDAKALGFFGDLAHLADPSAFAACLAAAQRVDWIVYSKKPFGGPAQVLAYLGRYTHRVAIANSRIQDCDDDHVAFAWKDYRDGGAVKTVFEARRVHPALPTPRLTRRLPSHSPLRIPRQWPPNAKARPLSLAPDRRGRTDDARKDRIANIRAERNRRP
jgi:hypothetical protein